MRIQLIRYHDLDNQNSRLPQSLNRRQGVLPPLGVAYVASALEAAGHQVGIIDAIAERLDKDVVRRRIREFQPTLVGVTAMTPTFRGALEAARLAKEEGVSTMMGGVHMALFARETLSYDFVDYGVVGEGEETAVELVNRLDRGQPINDLQGLAYKENGQVKVNGSRLVQDLDRLPFPAFHLLPMQRYASIIGLHPVSTIMGSRGCPYRCGFCYKTPSDKKYRRRSVSSIVDEIDYLIKRYRIKEVMFYDDLMPTHYATELCEELLTRQVQIAWETPQRVNLVTPSLLRLMKRAGCRMLRYGVEQGDPEMMQLVEKKITRSQVEKVFRWTEEAGLDSFAYFIIGYANETPQTMGETIALAKQINPRFVMFTKATPLPETPLMELAVSQGLIDRDYWRDFTLGKPQAPIPPFVPDADRWVRRAYREFYFRPKRILQQLFRIRSRQDLLKSWDALVGLLFFRMNQKTTV